MANRHKIAIYESEIGEIVCIESETVNYSECAPVSNRLTLGIRTSAQFTLAVSGHQFHSNNERSRALRRLNGRFTVVNRWQLTAVNDLFSME